MTRALPASLRRLAGDGRGVTVVEFAIVAPVICLFLVGSMDISYRLYMKTVLQGALQKAARDAALETGSSQVQRDAIDDRVRSQIVALNATIPDTGAIHITRRFYRSFTKAGQKTPEDWTDADDDGRCNDGELFDDANHNGVWDADGADAGQGGAKDAVLYKVVVRYRRMLPVASMLGWEDTEYLTASTILQNQPYADQGKYVATPTQGKCS